MIDYLNPQSSLKAINAFIFAGSFTIGVMRAGFHVDRILEISDDQPYKNAFYFIQNSKIPIIIPSIWNDIDYLKSLNDVDLMCCNCPCSSLSAINRQASLDGKNNIHFYRLFDIFNLVQPKVFVIENAPTLITLGLPILKDCVKQLQGYNVTIIRDYAGNHGVAMQRQRTLVVGWNTAYFPHIPLIPQDPQPHVTVKDVLGDIYDDTTDNMKSQSCEDIKSLYCYCPPNTSLMTGLVKSYMNGNLSILKKIESTKHFKEFIRIMKKIKEKSNYWDKSPFKLKDEGLFPSFTSVTEYIHPHQNRLLNLREMARIMNYPDDFDFSKKCKVPVTQAMAQGVPANFGQYIANNIRKALQGELNAFVEGEVCYQHHIKHRYVTYNRSDFLSLSVLDVDSHSKKLKE